MSGSSPRVFASMQQQEQKETRGLSKVSPTTHLKQFSNYAIRAAGSLRQGFWTWLGAKHWQHDASVTAELGFLAVRRVVLSGQEKVSQVALWKARELGPSLKNQVPHGQLSSWFGWFSYRYSKTILMLCLNELFWGMYGIHRFMEVTLYIIEFQSITCNSWEHFHGAY